MPQEWQCFRGRIPHALPLEHHRKMSNFSCLANGIPHTSKTLPLTRDLTKYMRETTFEMFQNVSNVVLALRSG